MLKQCKSCYRKIAVARLTCDCGYKFRPKKDSGFKEMPIILTPDRLRHAVARVELAAKSEMSTHLASVNKSERKTNLNIETKTISKLKQRDDESQLKDIAEKIIGESNQADDEYKNTGREKLYPKRTRNKTPKFETYHYLSQFRKKSKSTKEWQQSSDSSKGDVSKSKTNENSNSKVLENKTEPMQIDYSGNNEKVKLIQSPSFVTLRKPDGDFLTENIDAHIEIQLSSDTEDDKGQEKNNTSGANLLLDESENIEIIRNITVSRSKKGNFTNESDSTTESTSKNNISSSLVSLPPDTMQKTEFSQSNSEMKSEGPAKRKRGRPRKNFDNKPKIKRPVGRPPTKSLIKMLNYAPKLVDYSPRISMVPIRETNIETLLQNHGIVKRRRGRPKGSKDTKKRRRRESFHPLTRDVLDAEVIIEKIDPNASPFKVNSKRAGRCFLSPPSLMASAKRERIRNEILETVEKERLERKLKKNNGIQIPPQKKEMFSLILAEINRRILSQSFVPQTY